MFRERTTSPPKCVMIRAMTQVAIETRRICVKTRFRLLARKVLAVSTWGEDTVQRAATEIRRRRTQLGLSAQALADRTTELGHTVSRTTISDLELGRRGERLLVTDLIVLAAALGTSPGALLYPDVPHGPVEVLPGISGTSVTSARWLGTGQIIHGFGATSPMVWDSAGGDNEAVALSHALERVLVDVDLYLGLSTSAKTRDDGSAQDAFLATYERHRERALGYVKQLRELGAPLDEELLAHLGVIEVGDDG